MTAGPDWQLGNALPLVEVRGQGALVMRRADERWALADVTTAPDFAVEVDVDFRSGPGFGVLFRAERRRRRAACPATRSTSTRSTTAAATSCASGRPTASCGTRSPASARPTRRDVRARSPCASW